MDTFIDKIKVKFLFQSRRKNNNLSFRSDYEKQRPNPLWSTKSNILIWGKWGIDRNNQASNSSK